jgi:hypothetical protein
VKTYNLSLTIDKSFSPRFASLPTGIQKEIIYSIDGLARMPTMGQK